MGRTVLSTTIFAAACTRVSSFLYSSPLSSPAVRSSTVLSLNRFILDPEDLSVQLDGSLTTFLPISDNRAQHAANVLRIRDGDSLRVGVLNQGVADKAEGRWVWPADYTDGWDDDLKQADPAAQRAASSGGPQSGPRKRSCPGRRSQQKVPPLGLELRVPSLVPGCAPPRVDLLLALPRPLQLERMLPIIAQVNSKTGVVTCTVSP